ncbi:MAG: hypothetical protein AAGG57_02835 [Pseudomonadota bacterium]
MRRFLFAVLLMAGGPLTVHAATFAPPGEYEIRFDATLKSATFTDVLLCLSPSVRPSTGCTPENEGDIREDLVVTSVEQVDASGVGDLVRDPFDSRLAGSFKFTVEEPFASLPDDFDNPPRVEFVQCEIGGRDCSFIDEAGSPFELFRGAPLVGGFFLGSALQGTTNQAQFINGRGTYVSRLEIGEAGDLALDGAPSDLFLRYDLDNVELVGAVVIPLPAGVWLLGGGLVLAGFGARRAQRKRLSA